MRRHETLLVILVILLVWAALAAARLSPLPAGLAASEKQYLTAQAQADPAGQAEARRRLLAFQPWRQETWLEIGRLELAAGNLQAGIAALEQYRASAPLPAQDWLNLSRAYLANGQPEQATREWDALAAAGGLTEAMYAEVFDQTYRAGDLPAARQLAQSWNAAFPQDARSWYWRGLLAVLDAPQDAAAWLQQAADLDASYQDEQGVLAEAIARGMENPDPAYRLLVHGRALASLGCWDLAREAFERAAQLSPGYAEAWALLGQAQIQSGQDGYPALEKAEQLNPHSVIVRASLGVFWRQAGQPDQALTYFEALAEQEMDRCIWSVELGRTYEQKGNLDTALALFQRAVEVQPESVECWRELALFSANQNLQLAGVGLPAARQVLQLAPDEPASYDLMGWALLVSGDSLSAEKFFRKALDIQEDYLPAHIHLAQTWLLRGIQTSEAAEHLHRVLQISPGSTEARAAQTLLEEYHLQ